MRILYKPMLGFFLCMVLGWQIEAAAQSTPAKSDLNHVYIAPHVPATDKDWSLELMLLNPNYRIVEIEIESYTKSGDSSPGYGLSQTITQSLLPYQMVNFSGQLETNAGDRWIRVRSSMPIGGWVRFRQKSNPSNQAVLPLQSGAIEEGTRYFAHIPTDRSQFWSGFSAVNLGEPVALQFKLWSASGQNLDHLMRPDRQNVVLPRNGKRLSLFEGELFDDSGSAEPVAWVEMIGGPQVHGLALFGQTSDSGLGDLAGITAGSGESLVPAQKFFMDNDRPDPIGWVLVNPHDTPLTMTLNFQGGDGEALGQASFQLPPKGKRQVLKTANALEVLGPERTLLLEGSELAQLSLLEPTSSQPYMALQLNFGSGGQIEGSAPAKVSGYLALGQLDASGGKIILANTSQVESDIDILGISPQGERRFAERLQVGAGATQILNLDDLPENTYFLLNSEATLTAQWVGTAALEPITYAQGITAEPLEAPVNPQDLSVVPDPGAARGIPEVWTQWLAENATLLASLTSTTFADLQDLHLAIGDRRLVQLGESSHGAKEFSQIKVRLIKFLHQQMGFEVIAFESGFFEAENAMANIGSMTPLEMMKGTIFSVWHTAGVEELFRYLQATQATSRPLRIAGFDNQISSIIGSQMRATVFYDVLATEDEALANQVRQLEEAWRAVDFSLTHLEENSAAFEQAYLAVLELAETWLEDETVPPTSESVQNALLLKGAALSLLALAEMAPLLENAVAASVVRDRAMAENVAFLIEERFPQKKVALWAHNAHIIHNSEDILSLRDREIPKMGTYLEQWFRESLYSIALYMYRGESALNNRTARPVYDLMASSSIETVIHTIHKPFVFVEMLHSQREDGNSWMTRVTPRMRAYIWGGPAYESMIPKNHYDAILYIDETSLPDYR